MEQRPLGSTGLAVSALGFGCGAVGGLMVRGDADQQRRAVSRAFDAGITYFDTAAQYGDGKSEENLGRVMRDYDARKDALRDIDPVGVVAPAGRHPSCRTGEPAMLQLRRVVPRRRAGDPRTRPPAARRRVRETGSRPRAAQRGDPGVSCRPSTSRGREGRLGFRLLA